MDDDVKKIIYGVLVLFLLTIVGYISFIYVSGCGFTLNCPQGQQFVERTPIPSLIPATMPVAERNVAQGTFTKCQVAAVDLIGAWVTAGYPETDKFSFTDVKGQLCEGTFAKDVHFLFTESSLWYSGAQACASCHSPQLLPAYMSLDLSTYQGILAGSQRTEGQAQGNDILGGGDWEVSILHGMLYAPDGQTLIGRPAMPLGRPPDVPANGPLVFAGAPAAAETAPTGALTGTAGIPGTPGETVTPEITAIAVP